ncbi:MAG: hypothetical protein ABI678_08945 [Kofleriaceae bacterium]
MTTLTSILAAACLAACSQAAPSAPADKGSAEIASTLDGKRAHGMLNCPSGVEGAVTAMRWRQDDVTLSITAPAVTAQRKIVTLAHAQERTGNPHGGLINNGSHGGPGTSGFCPIIHADTTVSVEEVANGVVVHIRPNDPTKLASLRTATEARVKAL